MNVSNFIICYPQVQRVAPHGLSEEIIIHKIPKNQVLPIRSLTLIIHPLVMFFVSPFSAKAHRSVSTVVLICRTTIRRAIDGLTLMLRLSDIAF